MTRAPQLFAVSVLLFVGVFSAAVAETYAWNADTHVTIQPTAQPGAVAEVHIHDAYVNRQGDNGPYFVSWNGMTVMIEFTYNAAGADHFVIVPPAGFMAVPPEISIPEHEAEVILIYPDGLS
jgi:hypothetical protein